LGCKALLKDQKAHFFRVDMTVIEKK